MVTYHRCRLRSLVVILVPVSVRTARTSQTELSDMEGSHLSKCV
jgi:hypothetical protein